MKQKNKENTEEKRKQVDEVIAKMKQGIKDVFESEKYKNYLKVMSKFYNYSIGNQILISMQNPKATNVLGYKSWQTKFKRQVKKGEKGIKILVPLIYKYDVEVENIDQNGNKNTTTEQRQNTYFKTSTVFDISQTEGKEIEDLNLVEELKFKVENFNSFFKCIKNISPVEIKFEEMKEDVNSYISLSGVNPNMLLGLLERRKYSKIYMCLDSDKAGIEASYKIAEEVKNIYEDIKVYLKIPEEKDYNETLKKLNGVEYIEKKGHPKIEFYRNMIVEYATKFIKNEENEKRLDELKSYRKIYKIFNEKEMLPLSLNEETLLFLCEKVDESIENIYKIIKQNSSLKTEEIFLSVYNKCNPAKDVGNSKERIKNIESQIVEIGKGFKEQVDIKILEEKQIELIKNLIQFLGFFIDEFELSFKNKEEENEQNKLSIKM